MSENGRPSPVEPGVSEVSGPQRRVVTTKDKLIIAGVVTIVALGFIWFNAAIREKTPLPVKTAAVAAGGDISVTYRNGTATALRIFDGRTGAILREVPLVSE